MRARTSVAGGPGRLAGGLPSVGPGCCPGHRQQGPPRVVGASPPGARGYAPSPCGKHGGGPGGAAAWPGRAPLTVPGAATRGAPSMAAAPPPLWGCPAPPPPGRVIQGEWPAERCRGRRSGAPASTRGPIKAGQAGADGAARHCRPSPYPPSLLELRVPPSSLRTH